eukprot:m.191890 g.191890  ORF g.191890 m.191890 type:complete len:563 (+) comp18487_c0_seq1:60-1748(+)
MDHAASKAPGNGPVAAGVAPLFSQVLCEVVRTDPLWGGRKVVATDPLAAGTSVMRERGLAVLVDELGSTGAPCSFCGVCFGATDGKPCSNGCADVEAALAPVEKSLTNTVETLASSSNVSSSLLRLWVRIIAAAGAMAQSPAGGDGTTMPAACRARLLDWVQALRGCAELDTSAPTPDWMVDVFQAAATLCDAIESIEPAALKAASDVLLPAIAASPAGRGKDGTATGDGDEAIMSMPEALLIVAGQLNRNGYSVRDVMRPNFHVAFGLFPAVAMFNHACSPNCAVVTFPDGFLEVRTLRAVPIGGELTVSYIDLLTPRETRLAELQATKEFRCHCLRCDSPDAFPHERFLSTPLCPKCRHTPPRLLSSTLAAACGNADFMCRTEDGGCASLFPRSALDAALRGVRSVLDEEVDTKSGGKAVQLQRALAQAKGVLASEHEVVIRTRLNLAVILEAHGRFKESAAHLLAALEAMSHFLDPAWPEQAEWWSRLGRIRLDEHRTAGAVGGTGGSNTETVRTQAARGAVEAFTRAHKALLVCMGTDHPLTLQLKKDRDGAKCLVAK